MTENKNLNVTIDLLAALIEVAAIARSAVATWHVVSNVTNGDLAFTVFTVATVEGVFLVSLFSLHRKATAPITALAALVFAGVMQFMELRILASVITEGERDVLRAVVAFAPIAILGMAYLQHLTQVPSEGSNFFNALGSVTRGLLGRSQSPRVIDRQATKPQEQHAFLAQSPASPSIETNGRKKK